MSRTSGNGRQRQDHAQSPCNVLDDVLTGRSSQAGLHASDSAGNTDSCYLTAAGRDGPDVLVAGTHVDALCLLVGAEQRWRAMHLHHFQLAAASICRVVEDLQVPLSHLVLR